MTLNCRRRLSWACGMGLVAALLLSRIVTAQSVDAQADLLLLHGRILTQDASDSMAQAMAIRHGIIVKVGTDAEVLEFAGKVAGTLIDLAGHTVTPGLIDTHAHIADGGVQELYGVKLSDATSVAEIVARVKAKVALVKPGEWVTGSGWDEGKLAERRYVTAADLDAVASRLHRSFQFSRGPALINGILTPSLYPANGQSGASAEGLGPISCYGLTNNNQAAAKLWDAPGGTGTPYQLSAPDVGAY